MAGLAPNVGVYPVRLDLRPNLLHEIGLIVARWSYLESQIDQVICYLLELAPRKGRMAVARSRLESRLDIVGNLIALNRPELDRDFASLQQDVLATKPRRDEIIAGSWVWDENTKANYPAVTRTSVPHQGPAADRWRAAYSVTEPLTAERAKEIRRKIEVLNDRARQLFFAVVTSSLAKTRPNIVRMAPTDRQTDLDTVDDNRSLAQPEIV